MSENTFWLSLWSAVSIAFVLALIPISSCQKAADTHKERVYLEALARGCSVFPGKDGEYALSCPQAKQ
jgi:hypothetical protein